MIINACYIQRRSAGVASYFVLFANYLTLPSTIASSRCYHIWKFYQQPTIPKIVRFPKWLAGGRKTAGIGRDSPYAELVPSSLFVTDCDSWGIYYRFFRGWGQVGSGGLKIGRERFGDSVKCVSLKRAGAFFIGSGRVFRVLLGLLIFLYLIRLKLGLIMLF